MRKSALVKHLRRVLLYLEEINTPVTKTRIKEDTGVQIECISECLSFLMHYKFVVAHRWHTVMLYRFNNKCGKLKSLVREERKNG